MENIRLRTVRYLGSFYEFADGLGWMPFWRVWITKFIAKREGISIKWIPQSKVKFN